MAANTGALFKALIELVEQLTRLAKAAADNVEADLAAKKGGR